MTPTFSPRMPIFPPGAPGMPQPIYFGQAPPAMIPQVLQYNLAISILSSSKVCYMIMCKFWLFLHLPFAECA